MVTTVDDFTALARLLSALSPWLEQLVIVGGWAHRLHRLHPLATNKLDYEPLRTRDADVALSVHAPLIGDIGAALQTAGFQRELRGEHTPPVTHYRLGDEDQGFYAEFLVPLQGSGYRRGGGVDATVTKAGITAQKLRHLELLLVGPWTVRVGPDVGVPVGKSLDVRVPNPVSFLAQKLLIQKHRPTSKQAQDALYIHDTLELFGRELERLRAIWLDEVRPSLRPRTAREVERLRHDRFAGVSDVIREAARLPQDRTLRPEWVQAACASGLEEIFAESPEPGMG